MIIIKCFSSFCDSNICMNDLIKLYKLYETSDYGKKYIFTTDDNYTHAIILNIAMPILNIPKENVIGLAWEPLPFLRLNDTFIEYAKKHIGKYYIGTKNNLPAPFVEHYSYLWHNPSLDHTPIKSKLMSIMISQKNYAPGHQYRHQLVKRILSENLPIDIYGRGCQYYGNDYRIRGEFEQLSLEPYENYKFHICIENFITPHYFSEKITNTLLASTTPIYLGCENIDQYFPNEVIKLTGNVDNDIILIKNICENPDKYLLNIDANRVKEKVHIENVIKEFLY
jgi:hypothetical protein